MKVVVLALSLAAGVCAASAPNAVAAQGPAPQPRPAADADRRSGAWIAAVQAHEPGQQDRAVLTVAAWTPREIERILPQVAAEADAARLLAKGLVLHADIGIAEHIDGVARHGINMMTVEDGRASGHRQVSIQWRIGRQIAASLAALRLTPQPGEGPPNAAQVERDRRERLRAVRAWYLATAAILQEDGHLGYLHTHVNAGMSVLGEDAVLLMYRATVRQAFADPRLQQFTRRRTAAAAVRFSPGGPAGLVTQPQQPSFELDLAIRDLRRALELDPQLAEARVRLAHALADKGRHDEAASLLRPGMDAALPPFLEYYGAVVLGRSEERLGRLAEAQAAFERARRRFPDAQVPRVALSRLALIDGRAAEGLDLLLPVPPAAGAEPAEDPWWWYFRTHHPNAGALIADLRGGVR